MITKDSNNLQAKIDLSPINKGSKRVIDVIDNPNNNKYISLILL